MHQKELFVEPPKPLDKVWIWQKGKKWKALFWKIQKGKLVFTTNGINEIKDCEWSYRDG